jgi:hypothetical protein
LAEQLGQSKAMKGFMNDKEAENAAVQMTQSTLDELIEDEVVHEVESNRSLQE